MGAYAKRTTKVTTCAAGTTVDPADDTMCKACAAKTYKLATDLSVCLACAAPNVVNAGKTDCGEKAEEEDKTSTSGAARPGQDLIAITALALAAASAFLF